VDHPTAKHLHRLNNATRDLYRAVAQLLAQQPAYWSANPAPLAEALEDLRTAYKIRGLALGALRLENDNPEIRNLKTIAPWER